MGYYTTAEIVKIVNKLIDRCGTRDPYKVAKELGINIIYRNFDKQRGAYKVILKNRFVFLKNGMHPVVADSAMARNRTRCSPQARSGCCRRVQRVQHL